MFEGNLSKVTNIDLAYSGSFWKIEFLSDWIATIPVESEGKRCVGRIGYEEFNIYFPNLKELFDFLTRKLSNDPQAESSYTKEIEILWRCLDMMNEKCDEYEKKIRELKSTSEGYY